MRPLAVPGACGAPGARVARRTPERRPRTLSSRVRALGVALLLVVSASARVFAGDGYVPSRGLERLEQAVADLNGEAGAALPEMGRKSLQDRARALLAIEDSQRRGDTMLDAEVKGASNRDEALAAEGERLRARTAALKARGDASSEERAALKAARADYNRRVDEHAAYVRGLGERVQASNLVHESKIARLTTEIVEALHANFVVAPNRLPTREFVKPEEITSAAERLERRVKNGYQPTKDEEGRLKTYCNFFLRDLAAEVFGYRGFSGKRANDIADLIGSGVDGWTRVHDALADAGDGEPDRMRENLARAQALANAGMLVVAAWRNPTKGESGHVAEIVPGALTPSGATWGKIPVPVIAQAGASVLAAGSLDQGFGDKLKALRIYVRQPSGPPPIAPAPPASLPR